MTSQAPGAPPTDGCPEPEQLAAYIDGGLPSGERTHVERHLVECAECRDIVGDSGELNGRTARLSVKWLAVGGLVAAAAALLLVMRGC